MEKNPRSLLILYPKQTMYWETWMYICNGKIHKVDSVSDYRIGDFSAYSGESPLGLVSEEARVVEPILISTVTNRPLNGVDPVTENGRLFYTIKRGANDQGIKLFHQIWESSGRYHFKRVRDEETKYTEEAKALKTYISLIHNQELDDRDTLRCFANAYCDWKDEIAQRFQPPSHIFGNSLFFSMANAAAKLQAA